MQIRNKENAKVECYYRKGERLLMSSRNNCTVPKLGIIVPSSNTTMEREFSWLGRNRFTVHTTRIKLSKVTLVELEAMERDVVEAASLLADADVDVIAYGCTSGSLFRGIGHDFELVDRIKKKTDVPAVATAGCVVNAFRHLNINAVAVATPYIDEVNKVEQKFLSYNGFEVVKIRGLGIQDNLEIGRTKEQKTVKLASEVNEDEADAVFISCTNLPTFDIIKRLEQTLGKPVVSSNTATLWSMLKTITQDYTWLDLGELFKLKRD